MKIFDKQVAVAVERFWSTRTRQGNRQGAQSGVRDHGNRAVATGGRQMDGFSELIANLLVDAGISQSAIFHHGRENMTLPGFFRPTKQWDLVVVSNNALLASIEFKSLCVPSFGNNYNNRIEEAVGSATDIWTAYREGAFQTAPRLVLGYLLLLEEADASMRPVSVREKHFPVFKEYRGATYAERCEQSVRRLVRERCYDTACFLLSSRRTGDRGVYREPASDLSFERFAQTLCNQVVGAFRCV